MNGTENEIGYIMIERPTNPVGFDTSLVFNQVNSTQLGTGTGTGAGTGAGTDTASASGGNSLNLSRTSPLNFSCNFGLL